MTINIENKNLHHFTRKQEKMIFERDGFKCVLCGRGKADGVEIHADHILPRELGGKATMKNGQTLCEQHNFQKKTHKQTDSGKAMFITLYESAKKIKDKEMITFCTEILEVFERNNVNGHIEWKR